MRAETRTARGPPRPPRPGDAVPQQQGGRRDDDHRQDRGQLDAAAGEAHDQLTGALSRCESHWKAFGSIFSQALWLWPPPSGATYSCTSVLDDCGPALAAATISCAS